ncbi:hypothetical protein B1A87_007755 [Arthrobacter sp. KBS0703]|uniref:hypothetical protein n=1 Tax=Arthrobacter sp. KBS0703 TaxID=1955698 RepID=UPI00098EE7E0|nr:hypothetical protein [Arthrobacter sp. KBS0703]TSE15808.1 hypothetical protein B1A87_007755 [Arthrobacter sp. KBS0703]
MSFFDEAVAKAKAEATAKLSEGQAAASKARSQISDVRTFAEGRALDRAVEWMADVGVPAGDRPAASVFDYFYKDLPYFEFDQRQPQDPRDRGLCGVLVTWSIESRLFVGVYTCSGHKYLEDWPLRIRTKIEPVSEDFDVWLKKADTFFTALTQVELGQAILGTGHTNRNTTFRWSPYFPKGELL